ncbi:MAG: DEAD/DEAH box helicase [Pseudomonadota bacterium]|nr:DEAD/DEAH box helicase [Pseudomonadota bacterium]
MQNDDKDFENYHGTNVTSLDKKTSVALAKIGVPSLTEMLLFIPHKFHDYSCSLRSIPPITGLPELYEVNVQSIRLFNKSGQMVNSFSQSAFRLFIEAFVGNTPVTLTVFGNVWPWKEINRHTIAHVYGVLGTWKEQLQINSPELIHDELVGKVVPVYPGKPGVYRSSTVARLVTLALNHLNEAVTLLSREIPYSGQELLDKTGYPDYSTLLMSMHRPGSVTEGKNAAKACRSLAVRHLIEKSRRIICTNESAEAFKLPSGQVSTITLSLPMDLTGDQETAVRAIETRLLSGRAMRILLCGDVGTGKTLTYLIPLVAAWRNGAKIGIVTANSLLVRQIATEARAIFPGLIVHEITSGKKIPDEHAILVGTTAIIHAALKHDWRPDILVVDEQQKFSMEQRESLMEAHTHYIEASATPIPRTVAAAFYGGMDYLTLRDSPVKKKIVSYVISTDEKKRLFDFIKRVIQTGAQCAVVYPRVDDNAELERRGVETAFSQWNALFPGKVCMLHGRLSDVEKAAVADQMRNKEKDILVASIAIELGITLPALKAEIVVEPERFGMSQLHQLRGRLARQGGTGHFFMYLPHPIEKDTMARIQAVADHTDGFELAEIDMNERGFGDFANMGDGNQDGKTRLLFGGFNLNRDDLDRALVNQV